MIFALVNDTGYAHFVPEREKGARNEEFIDAEAHNNEFELM